MAELTLRKDEELVVGAAQAVLDKYGTDSDLSDILHRVRESDATAIFNGFCKRLVDHLRPLAAISRTKTLSSFHQLSITTLKDMWRQLFTELEVATVQALTTQSVNRHLFNLLLLETKSSSSLSYEITPVVMGSEEENAVRYASGYVAMKLMKELMKKDTESAAQFVECLSHMAVEEEADFYAYTREWVKTVDRGGLFHIHDPTFLFFRAVEMVTQAFLPKHLRNPSGNRKDGLQQKITEDEDVQFYWSMVSVDIEDETASLELLQSIVELWVRIRGFSITSAWMDQYKRTSQKVTKAQKGLRKQLHKSRSDEH